MSTRRHDVPKIVALTPKRVADFAKLESIVGERPISEDRIKALRKSIETNGARTFVLGRARVAGKWYRVDGQHFVCLLQRYPELIPNSYALIESFDCDCDGDVSRVAASYNSRESAKGQRTVNSLIAAGAFAELRTLITEVKGAETFISTLDAALVFRHHGYSGWTQKKGLERAEAIMEPGARDFALWLASLRETCLQQFGSSGGWKPIGRSWFIAAMIHQWEAAPEHARLFWLVIANGEGLRGEAVKFSSYVRTNKFHVGRTPASRKLGGGGKGLRSTETAIEAFGRAVRTWNKVVCGEAGGRFDLPVDFGDPIFDMRSPAIKTPTVSLSRLLKTMTAGGQEHLLQYVAEASPREKP